jgi:hypothetical protein
LIRYFAHLGISVRIIYRTCQEKFGGESPHNLIPNRINESRITIFMDFKVNDLALLGINKLIAFPESQSRKLPLCESRLKVQKKVDLLNIPKE